MTDSANINADEWALGVINAVCKIDGSNVDPYEIEVKENIVSGDVVRLEMRIPAEILKFELGQAGVILENIQQVVDFVKEDIAKNPILARTGYLNILRGSMRRNRTEPSSIWRRIFSSQPNKRIAWFWVATESVELNGSCIAIAGGAIAT